MTSIAITHSHAEGTLVDGSSKGDGVWEILLGLHDNWRSFRSLGCLGLGQSRDKAAQTWKISRAAEALRAAGFDVEVKIDEGESRPFAEIEAERYERAGERADRYAGYADNAAGRSGAAYNRSHQIAERFAGGQPILVGHHSEGRARRDQERIHSSMRKSIDEGKKADYHASRAAAAERYKDHRESVPVTLRRIEKLEAEARLIQRRLDGTDRFCGFGNPATGEYRERISARADDIAGELGYWREHIARREADGVKIWSRADFVKGDFVRYMGRWYEVERVNPKSLSVPNGNNDHLLPVVTRALVTHALGPSQWVGKVTYDEVRGRMSAGDMAAALAAAEEMRAS
jgi:Domain of unknown function (DUF3560)